jgi:hypothetical protein
MKSLILFLYLATCSVTWAGEASLNLEENQQNFCQKMDEAKQEIKKSKNSNRTSMQFNLLLSKLFPSFTFKLTTLKSSSDVSDSHSSSDSGLKNSRNLIVSFGVALGNEQMMKEYEDANLEMQSMNAKVIKLLKTNGQESCMMKIQKLGFDPDYFLKKRDLLNQMKAQKSQVELTQMQRFYQKLPRKLQQNWPIQTAFHVAELKKILTQSKIDHLVIVTHANQEGHLVDSFGNYLPLEFFENLSSELKSLSIFSCHGKKVSEAYHLEKLISRSETLIFYPQSKLDALNDGTVLDAFPSFIKRISKVIDEKNILKNESDQQCLLKINEGEFAKGESAILLGDKYLIGYIQESRFFTYPFNCELLNKEKMISVHPLNPQEVVILKTPISLSMKSTDEDRSINLIGNFIEAGIYKGSLFQIN